MATLANPRLESWRYVPMLNSLIGIVAGHPKLKDGWIITSQVQEMHSDLGWARTLSRRYDLGARAPHGALPEEARTLLMLSLMHDGMDIIQASAITDQLLAKAEAHEDVAHGRH